MSLSEYVLVAAGLLVAATLAVSATAQEERPGYGPAVDIATAKKIANAAIDHAKSKGWNVAVAIVDNHGFLVYYERLDDTQTASAQIAVDKAKTAAMFRRPSRVFEEAMGEGRTAVLGLGGVTPIIGGLPIMVGGKVIGGCGASGVASAQDEEICQMGLAALN